MSKKNPISTKERLRHILKETKYLKTIVNRFSNIQEFENNEDISKD